MTLAITYVVAKHTFPYHFTHTQVSIFKVRSLVFDVVIYENSPENSSFGSELNKLEI